MKSLIVVSVALATLALASAASPAPLEIGPNGRYLVDDEGQPFLLTGDSAWSLFVEPTLAEAKFYLSDRAARGFNFVVANLIEHQFASDPPANANGDGPFLGAPFTTPNEAYFAHADSVVQHAESLGIVVMLSPVYLGYLCLDEGWCASIQAASMSQMRDWGRFVGARYGGYDNVLWSIGGDADPTPVKDKLREFVAGLRETDPDNLITAHNHRDTQAVTYWPGEAWVQMNNIFSTRNALYQSTTETYLHAPTLPYFLIEGFYENEHGATDQQLRAQSYWTVLTGGFGVVFGNCPLWHFGYSWDWCALINWEDQLAHPASDQMGYYRQLFESRRWWKLVPDLDNSVLVSGAGTNGSESYATAAIASDGSSIIAYAPTPRAMSFDTGPLDGNSVKVWWYDPANATSGLIGDYSGSVVNVPAWATGDRVIVIDAATIGFPAPGTQLPTSSPAAGTASRLDQNVPNPFNPGTSIRFELPAPSRVRITVFDARGRAVRQLVDRAEAAGSHTVHWDGRDDHGGRLPSGVYFYRMESEFGGETRRMVLLK